MNNAEPIAQTNVDLILRNIFKKKGYGVLNPIYLMYFDNIPRKDVSIGCNICPNNCLSYHVRYYVCFNVGRYSKNNIYREEKEMLPICADCVKKVRLLSKAYGLQERG